MGFLDRLYGRLPVAGQHAAVSAYGMYWNRIRFGRAYRRFVKQYEERDRFNADQWRDWQHSQLKTLLSSAARVPYYARTWNRAERIAASAGRLEDLPLLEKEPLRADAKQFLQSDRRRFRRLVCATSGTTGTPIDTYFTWDELRDSLAVREVRSAGWAGVSFRRPRATFSGRIVEPDPQSTGPFHRYNLVERQVYFSAFHLRADTAKQYVRALKRHRTEWMTGYAVSFYLLGQFILELGLDVPQSLRAIVTTSEKVTPEMRDVMGRAFGCRVFEEYSTVENCLFASECEEGRLHISPDVSMVEILRPDGTQCDPGEVGEVVTTCFVRRYQPLIRFRVGDLACWSADPCPCGRGMPVLEEVVGRLEDVIVGPDGRQMVRFHGVFVNQPHVREGQVIQESPTRFRLKIVPTNGFDAADVQDLRSRVQQRLGPVDVEVETVSEIPRTQSGKFKAVVNLTSEATGPLTQAP